MNPDWDTACSVDECGNRADVRGMCGYHYGSWVEPLRLDAHAVRRAHAAVIIAADRRGTGWLGQLAARRVSRFLTRFADSLEAEAEHVAEHT